MLNRLESLRVEVTSLGHQYRQDLKEVCIVVPFKEAVENGVCLLLEALLTVLVEHKCDCFFLVVKFHWWVLFL